jgi:Replication-relaxation
VSIINTLQLTPRDEQILLLVHRYGGLTAEHLHHRFFRRNSPMRACYRRLAYLVDADYLAAYRLCSLTGRGSGKEFLTLGREGRRLVAELLALPYTQVRSRTLRSSLLAEHHFAICWTRLYIERACEQIPGLTLVSWTPETLLRRRPLTVVDTVCLDNSNQQRTIPLIADASFTLSYRGNGQQFLLEQDQATVTAGRLQTKLRGYLRFMQTSRPVVPVLYVTTNATRVHQILTLAAAQARELSAASPAILVTTVDQLSEETIVTAPIWHQPGLSSSIALLPQAASRQEPA